MKRVIIWGTESTGNEICMKILTRTYCFDEYEREIICFVDSNQEKWGKNVEVSVDNQVFHILIENPSIIKKNNFDEVIIASLTGFNEILHTLMTIGVKEDKINFDYCKIANSARKIFLESYAKKNSHWHNANLSVAELGVFQGDFAKEINQFFPKNKLYLFDTFEGFDDRDLNSEGIHVQKLGSHLSNTSVDIVMNKMPNPQQVIIRKGWFPQSCYIDNKDGIDVTTERFCFVNIDTDLHDSIIAGLEFFYPRMEKGGVILVHDYFSFFYTGVKKAVDTFCCKENITAIPIGDILSIAIIK